jgi:4-alpha-glucanotransferase
MLLDRRRCGILLHPTSLPGPFGIGDLGPAAFAFLDFLTASRQSLWQLLPLGPTGYGDSPYASPSAFAGNPLLISPERLIEEGLLDASEAAPLEALPHEEVDFARLVPLKQDLLFAAFQRGRERLRAEVERFRARHHTWLEDFALFSALKDHHQCAWTEWETPLRDRDPDSLAAAHAEYAERVDFHVFCQYLFAQQWSDVRAAAHAKGIGIVGDIPIFVAHDSADVWAHQALFKLDATGQPQVMAGVPPDYFSATGQLWGNPLYDWQQMAERGYDWWIARFGHLIEQVDLVRIDHFRGFEAAWEVPAGAATAVDGAWVKGPGRAVFDAIAGAFGGGQPPVIAEDLGLITPEVHALLGATRFPGMKVLQFAFGGDAANPYLPHHFIDPNCVVYTGTHDNDTTRGWFASAPEHERTYAQNYLGSTGERISEDLMRLALQSTALTAIVPMQDVLDLGSEARMNVPGATHGNWSWRALPDQLDARHGSCLAELTQLYGRSQTE